MKEFDKTKIDGLDSLSVGYRASDDIYKNGDSTDLKEVTIQDFQSHVEWAESEIIKAFTKQ